VLLALWLAFPPTEADRARRAARSVHGEDEPHLVTGASDVVADGGTLEDLLAVWHPAGPARPVHTAALLPVPGDVSGLTPAVARPAVDAGECVLVAVGDRSWAAVPEVVRFGSAWEPGHLVTWHLHEVPDWRMRLPGLVGSLADAELDLRRALVEATEALAGLDVARWRPDAAQTLAALARDSTPTWPFPRGLPPRALHVLVRALRLRAIVELATADDGGAINLWQADQRSAALRDIDHAARRAVAAATAAAATGPREGGQARTDL
jgi:hypothetical protein